ncbi:MAG TPA: hypothetical protein VFR09_01430, partial [Alphaproteobacteria bacterium]|nr:hypothetical protein [Alphaproteobacteria bacterium]
MSASPDDKTQAPAAPLPPRKESALARYPRKVKVVGLVAIVALLISPLFFSSEVKQNGPKKPSVHGQESKAARANPTPEAGSSDNNSPTFQAGGEALNDQDDHSVKMVSAPDTGLSEDTPDGSLPRIGEDGRQPWQVYARP